MKSKDLPALIILIRNPELGKGKTRLAHDVGAQKAFEIYLELLLETQKLALKYEGVKYIFYSEFIDSDDMWGNENFNKNVQKGDNLGERISQAFEEVLGSHSSAFIIGSDCPYLENLDLLEGAEAFENSDLVVGPAEDGGYYLLGLKAYRPTLFENINWSSPTTLQETLSAADKLDLKVSQLRMLSDIDDFEDWKSYLKHKNSRQLL